MSSKSRDLGISGKKKLMTKAYIVEINSEVRSPVSVDAPHHEISLAAEVVAGKTIDRAIRYTIVLVVSIRNKIIVSWKF